MDGRAISELFLYCHLLEFVCSTDEYFNYMCYNSQKLKELLKIFQKFVCICFIPTILSSKCVKRYNLMFYISMSVNRIYFKNTNNNLKTMQSSVCKANEKNTAMRDTRLPCFTDFQLLLNSTATWCPYGQLFRFPHYPITIICCRL